MSSNIEVQRICEYCDKEFTARTTKTRFCSHACNSRAYKANIKSIKVENSNKEFQRIIAKTGPVDHHSPVFKTPYTDFD